MHPEKGEQSEFDGQRQAPSVSGLPSVRASAIERSPASAIESTLASMLGPALMAGAPESVTGKPVDWVSPPQAGAKTTRMHSRNESAAAPRRTTRIGEEDIRRAPTSRHPIEASHALARLPPRGRLGRSATVSPIRGGLLFVLADAEDACSSMGPSTLDPGISLMRFAHLLREHE